jgi:hypothetical protein
VHHLVGAGKFRPPTEGEDSHPKHGLLVVVLLLTELLLVALVYLLPRLLCARQQQPSGQPRSASASPLPAPAQEASPADQATPVRGRQPGARRRQSSRRSAGGPPPLPPPQQQQQGGAASSTEEAARGQNFHTATLRTASGRPVLVGVSECPDATAAGGALP